MPWYKIKPKPNSPHCSKNCFLGFGDLIYQSTVSKINYSQAKLNEECISEHMFHIFYLQLFYLFSGSHIQILLIYSCFQSQGDVSFQICKEGIVCACKLKRKLPVKKEKNPLLPQKRIEESSYQFWHSFQFGKKKESSQRCICCIYQIYFWKSEVSLYGATSLFKANLSLSLSLCLSLSQTHIHTREFILSFSH